jgi:cation diffusion facilitator family transporter
LRDRSSATNVYTTQMSRHDQTVSGGDEASRDRRLLLVSVWASTGFAVGSSIWGVLAGSSMIVFDGLYSFLSIGLSLLAVLALRASRRGASESYPWGREAWEPLVVVVKALALGVLCIYAAVGGVRDLTSGGTTVATGWALVYAVLATAAGAAVTLVLRRGAHSDLVRAEAAEWQGDTLLSFGVLIGFGLAEILVSVDRENLAAYVDPAMVVAFSLLFLRVPAHLISGGLRELLGMAPPEPMRERLQRCIDDAVRQFGMQDSVLRVAKVGPRLDVEIGFVVSDDSPVRTVADCDRVRQHLHDQLTALGYHGSAVVAFTTERRWVT